METVAFYSYKGGVGRTLLLANCARFLAMSGLRVVAVDLDLEAPGLHYKFCLAERLPGAVCYLHELLRGAQDMPLSSLLHEVQLPTNTAGTLHLLPAGAAPEASYWQALSKLRAQLRCNAGTGLLEALLELKARISEEYHPDYLLIDARTGVTELGGLATTALADRVVLLATPSREAVDGISVIAGALTEAPTIDEEHPRSLHFVLARVQGGEQVTHEYLTEALKDVAGAQWFELPNDPMDGAAETSLSNRTLIPIERFHQATADHTNFRRPRELPPFDHPPRKAEQSLLAATLRWLQVTFPMVGDQAEQARHRLIAVEACMLELTSATRHIGRWTTGRDAWRPEQLDLNVRHESKPADGSTVRTADIIVRHPDETHAFPAMVIEYVDDAAPHQVASWWFEALRPEVVVVLHGGSERSTYSKKASWGRRPQPAERSLLPTPTDFRVLDDPADHSLEALLKAVRRSRHYNEHIIRAWVHCNAVGIHGGMPWDPDKSKKILDAIVGIEDEQRAMLFVAECAHGSTHRDMWVHSGDDELDQLVHEQLCAPLCWRIPPAAFASLTRDWRFGPPPGQHGLQWVARLMGLSYDPDAALRHEARLRGSLPALGSRFMSRFQLRALRFEHVKETLYDSANDSVSFQCMPYHGVLGQYNVSKGLVQLSSDAVEKASGALGLKARHVGSVAQLHLATLALMHLASDLDGRIWTGFSLGDGDGPRDMTGPTPSLPVVLAQVFVDRALQRLGDAQLRTAFEALTGRQDATHRSWQSLRHISLESAHSWLLTARRGAAAPPLDLERLLTSYP